MNAALLIGFYYLGIVSSWYWRSSRTLIVGRVLMLDSVVVTLLLKILGVIWTVSFLYLLFFVDWKLALASFVVNFISSYIHFVEDAAIYPFAWLAQIALGRKR